MLLSALLTAAEDVRCAAGAASGRPVDATAAGGYAFVSAGGGSENAIEAAAAVAPPTKKVVPHAKGVPKAVKVAAAEVRSIQGMKPLEAAHMMRADQVRMQGLEPN